VQVVLPDDAEPQPVDGPGGQPPDSWLLPQPDSGIHTLRTVEQYPRPEVEWRSDGDVLKGDFPEQKRAAVVHFNADLLNPRDQTSCVLQLPRFEEMPHVWSAVVGRDSVELAGTESVPVPGVVDRNGVSLWECEPRENGDLPAQCTAEATFRERDDDFESNLNVIMIGAVLSLGLTLFVEALVRLSDQPTRTV
jgi:hypothetical protein